MSAAFTRLIRRVLVPRTTVRWRLTLLYGGMFVACGAGLLAITYALVVQFDFVPGSSRLVRAPLPRTAPNALMIAQQTAAVHEQRAAILHHLLLVSGVALGIMAVASMLLGWLVAGRVLAPLRTITATTQQISAGNLYQRLALPGRGDELTQLADTIDGLLERLDGSFEAQRRFVANASHELRTPLTTMRAVLDVAIAKPDVPPQLTVVDANLRQSLDQADGLVESFLVLARAQQGELRDRQPVELDRLVTDALRARTTQITKRSINVHTALKPVTVGGSETLLARMVENVIENAIRHNRDRGSIDVTVTHDGANARLAVDSGGDVVDEQAVAQLAQPFRRLGQDRIGSQNGHGLGLSIVAAIAAAHNGTLELHARPQGGLRVQVTMPAGDVTQPAAPLA